MPSEPEHKSQGHVTNVPCKGGPHGSDKFAVHSFGRVPEPVPHEVTYDSHPEGRYVLRSGVYVWESV